MVARELAHEAAVLIAEQPTRGVAVVATDSIYRQLVGERDRGRAAPPVSPELTEVLGLSDRIPVM